MVRFGCSGNENAGIKPEQIKFGVANYIFTVVKPCTTNKKEYKCVWNYNSKKTAQL